MAKYAFFLDIDGTLLDTASVVSEENKAALCYAKEQGCKIFVNTGRGYACIPDEILSLPLDGIVAGCGCTVLYGGKVVHSEVVPNEAIYSYLKGIEKRKQSAFLEGENCLFRMNCEPTDAKIGTPLGEYCHAARLDFSLWQPLVGAGDFLKYPQPRIPKLNLVGSFNKELLLDYQEHFDGVIDEVKCEMYTKGHSKATGLRLIMQDYLPGFCSVAIGDSVNDIDMFRAADISVAMGNASEVVKQLCIKQTAAADDNGVGKAIMQLLHG
ncbi:MAG: HAD hydrolase family protein [Clostridiales bacterium]|nr:HAD hydrolase family protein [Clostridiales bacterium]